MSFSAASVLKYTHQVIVAYRNMQCDPNLLNMGVLKASQAAVIAEVERLRLSGTTIPLTWWCCAHVHVLSALKSSVSVYLEEDYSFTNPIFAFEGFFSP